jgi:N-hydroxyarylamine O-acetyltransferase
MTASFDLDAYLKRIGYDGERRPTPAALQQLQFRHVVAIPFENLTPLMGQPVLLDLASLQQKMVRTGRGGYCFEHNLLFNAALNALGFHTTLLGARVLWNTTDQARPPRTHMLVRVDLEGQPHIADVGFGGVTLTGPLRLEAGVEQSTPHEPFRLTRPAEGLFVEEVKLQHAWIPLYEFEQTEYLDSDYEMANWYVSTHPASRFVTGLLAARVTADRRYALRDNRFAVHYLDGRTERRVLASVIELRETLETAFRIALPGGKQLDTALARIIAGAERH